MPGSEKCNSDARVSEINLTVASGNAGFKFLWTYDLDITKVLLYATNYVEDPTEHNAVSGLLRRLHARKVVFWQGEAGPNRIRPQLS